MPLHPLADVSKHAPRVGLGVALCVPWLFIWQGVDFTDQGYALTNYRNFFRYPELTEETGSVWLTNLAGALWDAVFGRLGVVGARALWALCLSLGLLLTFRALRELTSPGAAALGVAAASLFLGDRRETWFSYNTSSSILFVLAALLLVRGLSERRTKQLFAAGVVMGLLPFARVPNVLAAGLVSTLALAVWLDRTRLRAASKELGTLALGALAGITASVALIFVLGQWPFFVLSLKALGAPAAEQSGYGASTLLQNFVRDETKAIGWGLAVCVAGLALSRVLVWLPAALGWALALGAGLLGAYGLTLGEESWDVVLPGTLYWLLASVVLGVWRRESALRMMALAALVVLVIAPLGSNNGIKNAHMGLWLSAPLGIALLLSVEPAWLVGQGKKLGIIFALAIAGEGAHQAATFTYRDLARPSLWTPVARAQLSAQFTSPPRARVVAEVLDALRSRVAPGDYLLAYEGAPLLQYLTETKPYLKRSWVMGAESGDVVAQLAKEAPHRTGCLPVAVATLKSTRSVNWPEHARRLEMKEPQRGSRKAIKAFLQEHGYRRKWSNGFFEILEPPASGRVACH